MPPMVVGTWGTTQANHCYAERISKEEERMKQRPVRPDPFENSLSTLLSQVHLDARLGHNEGGGKAASELSRSLAFARIVASAFGHLRATRLKSCWLM